MELRKLLWLNHGHFKLYGDDGEMQCHECGLDFKRDPVERIVEVFENEKIQKLLAESKMGFPIDHIIGHSVGCQCID